MAAPNNRKRKGGIDLADFDESLLIGSISDMPAEKAAKEPVATSGIKDGSAAEKAAAPAPETASETMALSAPAADGVGEGAREPATAELAGKQDDKIPKPGKAWEYNRFLTPTKGFKKSNIYISEENHQKVKSLLSLLGRGVSITDYVENMFAAHWEQYGPEIQKRLREHSFFK
jgi:hypothetical protein